MTSIPLSRLTIEGIDEFRAYLAGLRDDPRLPVPRHLIEDPRKSRAIPAAPRINLQPLTTKRQAATLLVELLSQVEITAISKDVGLWSWLGLVFFDSLCPESNGTRNVRADAHYILDVDHRRIYRHLLRTPFELLRAIPVFNRIFLDQPVSVHGELIEQIAGGRLYVIRAPSIAETVERLYFDSQTGGPKRGATSERRKGNLRSRLPIRVAQLQLTYDVEGMTADQLIEALGDEFTGWFDPA